MKGKFIAGYILVFIGILLMIATGGFIIEIITSPPPAGAGIAGALLVALGLGIAILGYIGSGLIFLLPGAYLVRNHESSIRPIIGVIVFIITLLFPVLIILNEGSALGLIPLLITFPLPAAIMMMTGSGRIALWILIALLVIDAIVIMISMYGFPTGGAGPPVRP